MIKLRYKLNKRVLAIIVALTAAIIVAPRLVRIWKIQTLPYNLWRVGSGYNGDGFGAPVPPVLGIGLGDRVTDADLAWLDLPSSAPDLKVLHVSQFVTDNGLSYLNNIPKIETIDLAGSQVKGPGLAHLASLPKLRRLILDSTPINDAGLAHLAGLRHLTHLSLRNTAITDAGIGRLTALPSLQFLDVEHTAVTKAGIGKLEAMPSLLNVNGKPFGLGSQNPTDTSSDNGAVSPDQLPVMGEEVKSP